MIIALPENFIGKHDQVRLESFAARLVARGFAARWHWDRERGVDTALRVFKGRADAQPMFCFQRNCRDHTFFARDASGRLIAEGALPHVLTIVDKFAKTQGNHIRA
jgi:hypothetical protein